MKKKILITDDTASWLFFHKKVIKELYGDTFDIETSDSAVSAFKKINLNVSNPFKVIITDLQMENNYEPLTAGEWLIRNIQRINAYSASKIIIISAMSNIEFIAKKINVECISKQLLVNNKLLMKYMFEKLMPNIKEIDN